MPTGAPAFEDYMPLLRSGDALISRVTLTGWQATASTLRTYSDRGRLWGKISPTSGDGYVQLYRRPAMASGDLIAHGTLSATTNSATLTAQNSSGISGSLDVPDHDETATHTFDIIVSYADEQDMLPLYAGLTGELDSNSKWEGLNARFEALLLENKRVLDNLIYKRLKDEIGTDKWGRPNMGYIADPRQLARVHALLCVSQIWAKRGVSIPDRMEIAKTLRAQAFEEFNSMDILLDNNRDSVTDGAAQAGSIVVRRA